MPVVQCIARTGGIAYVDSPNYPGMYAGQVMLTCKEAKPKQQVDNHMIKKAIEKIIKIMLDNALP
eukprot:5676887-Ditylum_brightwellii.AAC.1